MKKAVCSVVSFFMAVSVLLTCNVINTKAAVNTDKIYNSVTEKFLSLQTPTVSSVGGEWLIIGLSRADKISDKFISGYYKNVVNLITVNGSAKLHKSKSTENSRVILALTSVGKNVKNISGYNLLEPLSNFSFVKKQGLNGAVWALIAFDCGNFAIPKCANKENQVTRKGIVDFIISNQLSDGGWALTGNVSDFDVTAMVIQALTPYYEKNSQIKAAVNRGLTFLSAANNLQSCESYAQIIIALSSLGINVEKDRRFDSLLDSMLDFVTADGFAHTLHGNYNQMATEQAYLALTSYYRLLDGKSAIYDISNSLNPGDVNFDGAINKNDCTYIQRFIAKYSELSDLQKEYADVDKNLSVNVNDVTTLQRYLSKK